MSGSPDRTPPAANSFERVEQLVAGQDWIEASWEALRLTEHYHALVERSSRLLERAERMLEDEDPYDADHARQLIEFHEERRKGALESWRKATDLSERIQREWASWEGRRRTVVPTHLEQRLNAVLDRKRGNARIEALHDFLKEVHWPCVAEGRDEVTCKALDELGRDKWKRWGWSHAWLQGSSPQGEWYCDTYRKGQCASCSLAAAREQGRESGTRGLLDVVPFPRRLERRRGRSK